MVSLRIALRYLLSKKSHGAVNIISVISMAGVAVATVAIVCVLSVFNGFSDLAKGRLSMVDPEYKIAPVAGKVITNADSMAIRLSELPEVSIAMPTIDEQALALVGPRQMAVRLRGVPEDYSSVSNIENTIIDGRFLIATDPVHTAVLSVGSAIKLAARPESDQPFALFVPRRTGRINPSNPLMAFRSDSLTVTGVYEIDESDQDASTVIVPISVARSLLDYSSEASFIEFSAAPGFTQEQVRRSVAAVTGDSYKVMDRLEQEEQSFRMIAIEKWITFIMLAFILLIASFNVISTLSMLMLEKSDDMATLRALGARQKIIRRIFIWEGWLISAIGGLAGILIGLGLCLLQQYCGLIKLNGDASQLSVTVYPVRVAPLDLLLVMGVVIITGLFIAAVTSRFAPKR